MWINILLLAGQWLSLVTSGCVEKADIVFLIDASGSVGADNFQKELQFVYNMTAEFTISPGHVQIGVATFDSAAYPQIGLGQYNNRKSIQDAIQKIPYTSGGTRIDIALDYAIHESFGPKSGARHDAKYVLVVMTDGQSGGTTKMAYILKERHINSISIGIGSNVNKQELADIASDIKYMFVVTDFTKLGNIVNTIRDVACSNEVVTTPAFQWFVG